MIRAGRGLRMSCRARRSSDARGGGKHSSGIIASFAFVLSVLGVALYAVVRPFTHFDHKHEDDLWVHLP